jgi:hypothetical protein
MKLEACYEEHEKVCEGKLEMFTMNCRKYIHVELFCHFCEKRYVTDVYNLEEV